MDKKIDYDILLMRFVALKSTSDLGARSIKDSMFDGYLDAPESQGNLLRENERSRPKRKHRQAFATTRAARSAKNSPKRLQVFAMGNGQLSENKNNDSE